MEDKKGDNMAEYKAPEEQRTNARANEQSEKVEAKQERSFSEKEVLELLEKAKEVNNG